MKKLSLFVLSALICPVAQADIKEHALRGITAASFVAGAWMIGETMRRSNNSAQEKLDESDFEEIPESLACYLNDFLRACNTLGADEVQQFKMYLQVPPTVMTFAADGVIYLNRFLVAALCGCLEDIDNPSGCLEGGDNPKDRMSSMLGGIVLARGLIVLNENPYNWGVWGAMAGTWCAMSGVVAAATIPNPTMAKTIASWVAVAPITIIASTAGLAWLMKCTRDAVRNADQYVIDHISDPKMLEAMADQIFYSRTFQGRWYQNMPSCEERAAIYRAAADTLRQASSYAKATTDAQGERD